MSKIQTSKGEELLVTALDRTYLGQEKTVMTVDGDGNTTWLDALGQSALAIDFASGDVSVSGVSLAIGAQILTINVDPAGSDLNDGVTAPVATLQRALELVPPITTKFVKIKLTAGAFDYTNSDLDGNYTYFPVYYAGKNVGTHSAPLLIEGELTNELGNRTATANDVTGAVVTDGSLAMVPNDFRFAWIEMLTGASAGQSRMIRGNTATAFTLNQAFTNGVAIGDTFQVQRNASIVTLNSAFGFANGFVAGLNKLKLIGSLANFNSGNVYMAKCEFDLGGGFISIEQSVRFNCVAVPFGWAALGSNNPFSFDNTGGCYIHDGGIFQGNTSTFAGYVGMKNVFFLANTKSIVVMSSALLEDTTVVVDQASFLSINSDGYGALAPSEMIGGGMPGVGQVDASYSSVVDLSYLSMDNAADMAVRLGLRSFARVEELSSPTTPAAGYGIVCESMSQVHRNGAAVSVTGTLGDTLIGAVPKAHTELPFSEIETENLAAGIAASTGAGNSYTGLTGAGLTDANVGDLLVVSGFTTGSNNGTKLIIEVLSPTSCVVAQTVTAPDANDGAGAWTLASRRPTLNRVE